MKKEHQETTDKKNGMKTILNNPLTDPLYANSALCIISHFAKTTYLLRKLFNLLAASSSRSLVVCCLVGWSVPDMEKRPFFFTPTRFEQKLFYQRKCKNCNKSELVTKQRKLYLTTCMNKIGLPHIYRGNSYVIDKESHL